MRSKGSKAGETERDGEREERTKTVSFPCGSLLNVEKKARVN